MGAYTSAGRVNEEACTRLDNKVDPAPPQTFPVKEGHTAAGAADSPRSVASCSTSDRVEEMPAQKHVFFSATPAEVLHIVPYSEMYLLHPSKFEFDSDGRYITDDESIDTNLRSAVRPEESLQPSPRQQLASGPADVALPMRLSGPLLKLSPNALVGWQLRWFEVGGGSVRYYTSPGEAKARAKPAGEVSLAGLRLQRQNVSVFDFTALQTGDRIFSLVADVGSKVRSAGWELGPAGVPTVSQWVAALQQEAEAIAEAKEEAE